MDEVIVQPMGGFVGAGGAGHVKSEGRVAMTSLSKEDQAKVDALFAHPPSFAPSNFYYRLTRSGPSGAKTIDVPMESVPAALVASVKSVLQ